MFKKIAQYKREICGAAALSAASAFAAVPTDVTTAMSDMKTDGLAVAGAFLVALIAIAAFGMMRRGIKG